VDRGDIHELCAGIDHQGKSHLLWNHSGTIWIISHQTGGRRFQGSRPLGFGFSPRLAVTGRGKGMALWIEPAESGPQIMSLAFGSPECAVRTIHKTQGRVKNLQVAVDQGGSAIAIWTQSVEGFQRLLAQTYDAHGNAWLEKPVVLGPAADRGHEPQLALNVQGCAIVLWEGEEGLLSCHYRPNDRAWSGRPVLVSAEPTGPIGLTIDPEGNICALWTGPPGLRRRMVLLASRYSAAEANWTTPEVLITANRIHLPKLALFRPEEVIAAWCHEEEGGGAHLFSKFCRKGIWDSSVTRLDLSTGTLADFDLAQTCNGEGLLLMVKHVHSGFQVQARRLGKSWTEPQLLGAGDGHSIWKPVLCASPKGAFAAWIKGAGPQAALVAASTVPHQDHLVQVKPLLERIYLA
jgi:hypothetical protein